MQPMFSVGDSIIYPVYGIGKISRIYQEKIDTEVQDYYEIELTETAITLSVPIEESEELGLRKPSDKKSLTEKLNSLWKKVNPDEEDLKNVDNFCKEKLKTGKIEDVIELINTLKFIEHRKDEKNKNLSFSESRHLERAFHFIGTEIKYVLGKKALDKYNIQID